MGMAEFIKVAELSEIPPGTSRRVEVNGYTIALFNIGGQVYAIDDTCTHEQASLSEGTLHGEIVACPRHGARFHVPTGRVLSLPAVRSVATYPVRVEGGAVYVAPAPQLSAAKPHRP